MKTTILKNIKIYFIAIVISILIFIIFNKPFARDDTISDIAYDVNSKFGFTVYIKEDGAYTPYLVLTNKYGTKDNVLLLRKYVMDEDQPYNKKEIKPDYATSDIDRYLDEDFLNLFEPDFKNKILESEVTIYMPSSKWNLEEDLRMVNIYRKSFLLSLTEIDEFCFYCDSEDLKENILMEGSVLKYYRDLKRNEVKRGNYNLSKAAYKRGKKTQSTWWLRTTCPLLVIVKKSSKAATYYSETSLRTINRLAGIRPAFCVDGSMKIKKDTTIDSYKEVYVFGEY